MADGGAGASTGRAPGGRSEGSDGVLPTRRPLVAAARELRLLDERGVPVVHGIELEVRAGEILGLAGIEGAGQRQLVRALAGRLAPAGGSLTLPPPERIGFIPEDRHRDGAIAAWTLTENVALRGAGRARGRIPWPELGRRTAALIGEHGVDATGPGATLAALSGGNQQRVVLARELAGDPALIVAENPTRGLDLAATAGVHRRLQEARARGAAVVVTSSDLDEVLALADRVVVMFAGVAREVPRDRDAVGRAMLGLD
jgi:simple sugar transport system ATP-binding protein